MELLLSKQAQKYYTKADKNTQKKFDKAFDDIKLGQGDIKRLAGRNEYRYKLYHYRIIYTVNDNRLLITIIKIGTRSDIYK